MTINLSISFGVRRHPSNQSISVELLYFTRNFHTKVIMEGPLLLGLEEENDTVEELHEENKDHEEHNENPKVKII